MKTSESTIELFKALAKFQGVVESPKKSSENPAFKREGKVLKYADLDAIIKVITPALSENGLSQMQFTSSDFESKSVSIVTLLTHSSGEYIMSDPLILPAENFGKFNAQTIGSSITYGRRYSLSAMLGIASEDDDDANTQSLKNDNDKKPTPKNNNKPQQRKEQTTPIKNVQQLNDEIKEAFVEIDKNGGDKKAVQRLYLATNNLENFDNYNKTDFLEFLEEVIADMHVKQGELMKNGTTTANNVVDWGKTK